MNNDGKMIEQIHFAVDYSTALLPFALFWLAFAVTAVVIYARYKLNKKLLNKKHK